MAFFEVQFPTNISYGSKGGAGWLTRIVSTQSGGEYRSQMWSAVRGKWNVSHGLKLPADLQTLIKFFHSMQGRAHSFRFKDWNDYTDWGIGQVATNPNSQLQLAKVYTVPVESGVTPSFTRFIAKPVPGTVTISGGGSVDYTTGLCSGTHAGAAWTGQFDIPARFDVDEITLTMEQPGTTVGGVSNSVTSSWQDINVVEVRGMGAWYP
ncbi:MAG: DUF2460 domain-containing protein [Patescibacteria group bacterium]|nr:DUF2460 domain-containing protein [Patescibacteria group bacterium]